MNKKGMGQLVIVVIVVLLLFGAWYYLTEAKKNEPKPHFHCSTEYREIDIQLEILDVAEVARSQKDGDSYCYQTFDDETFELILRTEKEAIQQNKQADRDAKRVELQDKLSFVESNINYFFWAFIALLVLVGFIAYLRYRKNNSYR